MRPVSATITLPEKDAGEIADFLVVVARRFGFHMARHKLNRVEREIVQLNFVDRVREFLSFLDGSVVQVAVIDNATIPLFADDPTHQVCLPISMGKASMRPGCVGCPMWRRGVPHQAPREREGTSLRQGVDDLTIAWACALSRTHYTGQMRFVETITKLRELVIWTLEEWKYQLPKTVYLPHAVDSVFVHPRYNEMARTDGASNDEVARTTAFLMHPEQNADQLELIA